jgi:hypothetical protein
MSLPNRVILKDSPSPLAARALRARAFFGFWALAVTGSTDFLIVNTLKHIENA